METEHVVFDAEVWDAVCILTMNTLYDSAPEVHEGHECDGVDHAVYLFASRGGQPLYVGMTLNVANRFASHMRGERKWPRAAAFYWFDGLCCRAQALQVEALLIRHIAPVYNVAGMVAR